MSEKSCSACGTSWSIYDRVCECGALVHAQQLAELRTRARIGRMAKDPKMEQGALRRALQLVPEDHPEHATLLVELEALLNPPPLASGAERAGWLSRVLSKWKRRG